VRFLVPFDHAEPFWFYLPGLLLGLGPWLLLLPRLLRFLRRWSERFALQRSPSLGFFLLAFLWPLLFFSSSGCKRAVYILPALPPLALALGYYLSILLPEAAAQTAWRRLRNARTARAATAWTLGLAMAATLLAGATHLLSPSLTLALIGGGALLLVGMCCVRAAATWPVCAVTTFAVLLAGVQFLLPAYNRQFGLRHDLQAHAAAHDCAGLHIACYPQRYDSASFYLPYADVVAYAASQRGRLLDDLRARPRTLLLIRSGRTLQELLDELPGSMEFVTRGRPQGAVTVGWVRERAAPSHTLRAEP
jgi:4-amino-4-deoxy-L-arabinose transferase-like glycosyltransferase